jgi:hypothetical protein
MESNMGEECGEGTAFLGIHKSEAAAASRGANAKLAKCDIWGGHSVIPSPSQTPVHVAAAIGHC